MTASMPRRDTGPTDDEVQALLARHHCPTALHALRTLLLGNIASPRLDVSPMATLAQAWGGELPVFASVGDVEEVAQVIVRGLWNRLAEHQSSRHPFRLPRFEVACTRQALLDLARMRAQELEGFLDGLFGTEDEMALPQKAHEAVGSLTDLYAMFDGAAKLLADESKSAPDLELKKLLRNLQQLTIFADEAINKVVQSCKRARSHRLEAMPAVMSTRIMAAPDAARAAPSAAWRDDDEGPDLIDSPLSQRVTRNGVSVQVEIYRDREGGWILEVVDAANTSHVWDERFESDQQALDEALRALDDEPLEFMAHAAPRPSN